MEMFLIIFLFIISVVPVNAMSAGGLEASKKNKVSVKKKK